jgi:hypothetical protein
MKFKFKHAELAIIAIGFILGLSLNNKYIDSFFTIAMFYFIVRLRYMVDKNGIIDKGEALA